MQLPREHLWLAMRRKALFLDRDGVINLDGTYVHRIDDFTFIDGIFEVLKWFQDHDFLLVVVTNQAGIGRGMYSEHDFRVLTDWMLRHFRQKGIRISGVYYCPYHPVAGIGRYKRDAPCRKPNPGMIIQATRDFRISLAESVLVGDQPTDIHAGLRAGVGTTVLFRRESEGFPKTDAGQTYTIANLLELIPIINDQMY